MSRSDEHDYVTRVFIDCAQEMSRSEVFGYAEADRGRFDFACVLTRDNSRNLIGQTLTHHAAGIDKDLASLLLDSDGELPVYLYPHEARSEGRVQEFLQNARNRLEDRVNLLRLFRYPVFDSDNEQDRIFVADAIKNQIIEDLLLNVLFGRLSASDIGMFLNGTGIPGLLLTLLDEAATNGFAKYSTISKSLGVSASTIRPRIAALISSGMLEQSTGGSYHRVTPRARAFLRICHLLVQGSEIGPELEFILKHLDLGTDGTIPEYSHPRDRDFNYQVQGKLSSLVNEIRDAKNNFGAKLLGEGYRLDALPEGIPEPADLVWVGR